MNIAEAFSIDLSQTQVETLLMAAFTAQVRRMGREPIMTPAISEAIVALAGCLTGNGKYGAYICGPCGTGKTRLLSAIKHVVEFCNSNGVAPRNSWFSMLRAHDVVRMSVDAPEEYAKLKSVPVLGIDDLGDEPVEAQRYGNVSSPLVYLFADRYEGQRPTFVTTNLKPGDVAKRYGERIADRFRETMVTVRLTDESFRKQIGNVPRDK